MEAKKFISTLKGFRTRFTNKPNDTLEKKQVEGLVEKFGGKLQAIATLNETKESDLKDYLKKVLGVSSVNSDKKVGKASVKNIDGEELATVNGNLYRIDSIKKTMKRVYRDFKDINSSDIETTEMSMKVYQGYLKDTFPGEDAPIKKGKLHFRGYRISCTAENGFLVEDTTKRYEVVETPFEGIPTPKELGDWFKKPQVEMTAEDYRKAVARGKELAEKAKEEREQNMRAREEAELAASEEPDYEKLRRKVLSTIKRIRNKTLDFDPTEFPNMIPFKRWKRKVNSLLTQWKNRKIRYAKFLNEVEAVTTEETFVIEEKRHRSTFKGTLLPAYNEVGDVVGDKIEVDGKLIDAVPFLTDYLLCKEPRAMSQLMKFASGEITVKDLIKNPINVDWKVEYKKRALVNNALNVQVLSMLIEAVGLTAPQDILYNSGLKVGDKIVLIDCGELKYKKVTSYDKGAFLGKSTGFLLKSDKWFKVE